MPTPNFTRKDFVFIADEIAPMLPWATHIHDLAQKLKVTNRNFDYDRFVERATKAWEENHIPKDIDDEIPY
jgi:hypothetical protein